LLVPVAGWLGYRPAPFQAPARLFGALPMPVVSGLSPVSPNAMLVFHSLASWALLGLICLHVAAALFHGLVLKDGVLGGMISGRRSKPHRP
jgi:cytochrome b561